MISIITVGTRNILRKFGFFPPTQGDNALATIKDVNYVINSINNMAPYRTYDVSISQTGTNDPVITKLAAGAAECGHSCNCATIDCDCKSPCGDENAGVFTATMVRTGSTGSFLLTVGGTMFTTRPIKNVGFFVTPFSVVTGRMTFKQASATTYEIKTYTNAVLADGIFDKTVVAMKIYF